MEAKGLIERRRDKQDRRANRIWLTEKGQATLKSINTALKKVNKISSSNIDKDRAKEMFELLDQVRENLRTYKDIIDI